MKKKNKDVVVTGYFFSFQEKLNKSYLIKVELLSIFLGPKQAVSNILDHS